MNKLLLSEDIQSLWKYKVAPFYTKENQIKYNQLPKEKNTLHWKWEGKDFPRVISLLEFMEFCEKFPISPNSRKLLSFSPFDPETEILKPSKIFNYEYDLDRVNYDLHNLHIPEKDFDFCLLNQTLEHLYNPTKSLDNIWRVMAPSGVLHINAPAINIPHLVPFHYYTGFTLMGLVALLESCNFNVVSCGQWGNREYLGKLFSTYEWPDFTQLNSYLNDFNCPAIVWANAIRRV